jgi:hypothetical protein
MDRGKPSSWSGVIDTVSFGDETDGSKRLFIISGGNVRDESNWLNYPDGNKVCSIENPAQAWNALTVGAYTEKIFVDNPDFNDYTPLASARQMSPYNSTSITWQKKWPFKPDVVFEGGNVLKRELAEGSNDFYEHEDLQELTISKNFVTRQFDVINATSCATAKASWLAAQVAYNYPGIWPESIRGLIVHSASWSEEMLQQFNVDLSKKSDVSKLVRICGYGIPQTERVLNSFENGLTMIAQHQIQPYLKKGSAYKTNKMQLFDFPWPKDELLFLGEMPIKLKITLSYFIEPGPGQIGWKDKYRYASFGLRFDINKNGETADDFMMRINKAVRNEDYNHDSNIDSRWTIGKANWGVGSVHSDYWETTAAELADCNYIAVYPVIGWWRERANLKKFHNKARYSLLVSLETPKEDVELYTTIVNQIKTPVEIKV